MLVEKWMSARLISIWPDLDIIEAKRMLKENRIGRLPVIDQKGELVGIVSDRDVKEAGPSAATSLEIHELLYLLKQIKVGSIMTKKPVTIYVHDTIEEAAQKMLQHKIGGLPVVNDYSKVVGIITEHDVFGALISLVGIERGGIQFALEVPDRPTAIQNACDLIHTYGGQTVSILTSEQMAPKGKQIAYLRMKGIDRAGLRLLKDDLAQVGRLHYILDSRQGNKELLAPGIKTEKWRSEAA